MSETVEYIRDCANPAITAMCGDDVHDLMIETEWTFKGRPGAVIVDGVRYEPIDSALSERREKGNG